LKVIGFERKSLSSSPDHPQIKISALFLCSSTTLKSRKKEYLDGLLQRIPDCQAIRIFNTGKKLDFTPLRKFLIQNQFRPLSPPPVVTPIYGALPKQLTEQHEADFLSKHRKWRIVEREKPGAPEDSIRELYRLYEFPSHEHAWDFMAAIEERCIKKINHHPRLQNTFNRVEVWLSTFNVGHKPTKRDIRLAECIENTWSELRN
jgi:pterin-4a-carbinolamine dehydratase